MRFTKQQTLTQVKVKEGGNPLALPSVRTTILLNTLLLIVASLLADKVDTFISPEYIVFIVPLELCLFING